ncbi:RNA polymerase sigma factor, partial [bacterium]|nr:RNA polymerase sigma factor [bacterium]
MKEPERAGSDEDLLLAYAQGDRSALERLVERIHAPAYRLARRLTGDPGAAEDAVSLALIALVQGAPRFRRGQPFSPWWMTILMNRIRNEKRARARRARHEARAASLRPEPAQAAPLERREVEESLALLPLELSTPLVLHFYEGHTHEEVGRIVGCPTGTASSRIRRGLEELRGSLVGAGFGVASLAALEPFLRGGGPIEVPLPPSVARLEATAKAAAAGASAVKLVALALVVLLGTAIASAALVARGALSSSQLGTAPSVSGSATASPPGTRVAEANPGRGDESSPGPRGMSDGSRGAASPGETKLAGRSGPSATNEVAVLVRDRDGIPVRD